MSALVNANTRVGMGHMTREQRSMLAAKESARVRFDDAKAFLDPMRKNAHRSAWEERNAQREDRRAREAAAAAEVSAREAAAEERRAQLEALYQRERAAWAATQQKEAPKVDDLDLARAIEKRRKAEQDEAREIAVARLEAYRRAQTPEYREAQRLQKMHVHNERRARDDVDHASIPKAQAPDAVKAELVNDHFVPSEHAKPKCEVTIGFDDDGARTLSSGAKRRAFSRCCVEVLGGAGVDPLGLAVRVNADGRPELAATLVITGGDIHGTIEDWAARVEAGNVVVRGLRAKWIDSDAIVQRPPKHEAAAAYRQELQQAQEYRAVQVEEEKEADRALDLAQTSLFEPEKGAGDELEAAKLAAKVRLDALEQDAHEARDRKAADKAIKVAEEREELEELRADDRKEVERKLREKATRVERERAYRLELARQTQLEEELARSNTEELEEPSMAGLSWAARDRRKEGEREASENLRRQIERDWRVQLARKENRRPATFDEAEKALREKLWHEHRARLQGNKDLARAAHLNVQAENFDRAAEKRERDVLRRRETVHEEAPVAFEHDLPPHLARRLPASLRPATAGAEGRAVAQARRDRHNALAAGRPATAEGRRSRAAWEPLATSQWQPSFPQY